jgi:addiction module RelE/StbE family toxin
MLPKEIVKRYEKWKDVVRISGPPGLRLICGFHDEALKGKMKGYRSSRLSDQYRVIYTVNKNEVYIQVEEITPHEYRRK